MSVKSPLAAWQMNSEKSLQMENENFISQLWAVGSGRRGILFANLINCWLASEEKPRIQRSAFGRHQFSVVVQDNDDDDQIIIIILLRNCEKWQHQKKKNRKWRTLKWPWNIKTLAKWSQDKWRRGNECLTEAKSRKLTNLSLFALDR